MNQMPPDKITLVYREVGRTHVFTAESFHGFHIGSSSLRTAYEEAIYALGEHVSRVFGCPVVQYGTDLNFDEFSKRLTDDEDGDLLRSVVIATRSASEQVPA